MNSLKNFANIFKQSTNDKGEAQSEISFENKDDKNKFSNPIMQKSKPKGLELDMDALGDNGINLAGDLYPNTNLIRRSPLNMPQS